jgi:hypothetical protein
MDLRIHVRTFAETIAAIHQPCAGQIQALHEQMRVNRRQYRIAGIPWAVFSVRIQGAFASQDNARRERKCGTDTRPSVHSAEAAGSAGYRRCQA